MKNMKQERPGNLNCDHKHMSDIVTLTCQTQGRAHVSSQTFTSQEWRLRHSFHRKQESMVTNKQELFHIIVHPTNNMFTL